MMRVVDSSVMITISPLVHEDGEQEVILLSPRIAVIIISLLVHEDGGVIKSYNNITPGS